MKTYEVRVAAEVARTRSDQGGTRNVSTVLTFSRHPTIFLGEPPAEVRNDTGLEVRELAPAQTREILGQGALVSALGCPADRLGQHLLDPGTSAPSPPASEDLAARVESLESALAQVLATDPVEDLEAIRERLDDMEREELEEVHERLLGRKPHGNARDDSVRDAIRASLDLEE